nr:response regulator [Lachnospiraceae bacterium]
MFKILVIDDEELVRKGIVQGTDWDSMGCCVVGEAENGEEGLAAIHRLQPDLLICDIRMPRMDGLQLLEKLREERNDVPVIFLTAYSDFHYAQKALRFAASDYLLKPFEDGELEKAVRTVKEKALEDQGSQNPEEDLMGYFALTKGDKSKYVQEALTYITEHYNEPDISVKSIAESLGLSDGHLSHIFKKETDYTI